MDFFKPPKIARSLFSDLVFSIPNSNEAIYLTFDDGPHPESTPKILSLLDQFNAKATFFCLGKNVAQYPELFQEILDKGHAVGNHSYNHPNGLHTQTQVYIENVNKAGEFIQSNWFRPPYGKIRPKQVKALKDNYRIALWSLNAMDYDPKLDISKMVKQLKHHTQSGSIILFHDSLKAITNTEKILPEYLDFLVQSGFRLKVL